MPNSSPSDLFDSLETIWQCDLKLAIANNPYTNLKCLGVGDHLVEMGGASGKEHLSCSHCLLAAKRLGLEFTVKGCFEWSS